MTAPEYSFNAMTSASRLSISRWFVGSSRIRICGASIVAISINSRAFCPPESRFAGISTISAPNPAPPRRARTLLSDSSGRSRIRWVNALSSSSSSSSWCCAKNPTRNFPDLNCSPAIKGSLSASSLERVDLPSPLAPSRAMRSSLSSRKSSRERIALPS